MSIIVLCNVGNRDVRFEGQIVPKPRLDQLWVERLLGWFENWQRARQPGRVWPRLETIHRDIKFMLLEAISERGRCDLTPVLHAWFPHEVWAVMSYNFELDTFKI